MVDPRHERSPLKLGSQNFLFLQQTFTSYHTPIIMSFLFFWFDNSQLSTKLKILTEMKATWIEEYQPVPLEGSPRSPRVINVRNMAQFMALKVPPASWYSRDVPEHVNQILPW